MERAVIMAELGFGEEGNTVDSLGHFWVPGKQLYGFAVFPQGQGSNLL